jgi:hypothetical protein
VILETFVKTAYRRWLFPYIGSDVHRQRLKLAWFIWQYGPLLVLRTLPLRERIYLLWRFLRIDWYVSHSHLPSEIVCLCAALTTRKARENEVVVEAVCWKGGSAEKLRCSVTASAIAC